MPCNCAGCRRYNDQNSYIDYDNDRDWISSGGNPSFWNHYYGQGEHGNCLMIGIELELEIEEDVLVSDTLKQFDSDFFVFKVDGSLNDGVEIASHPATLKWLQRHPEDWNNVMQVEGLYEYDTCGMHIHLSSNMFVPNQVLRMRRFLYNNYDNVLAFSGRSHDSMRSWSSIENPDTGSSGGAIHRHDYGQKQTYEIRIFAATTDKRKFWANVEFTEALFRYTKDRRDSSRWNDFMEWIDKADRTKYKHLVEYLTRVFRVEFTNVEETVGV
jgi:hypothetical protein